MGGAELWECGLNLGVYVSFDKEEKRCRYIAAWEVDYKEEESEESEVIGVVAQRRDYFQDVGWRTWRAVVPVLEVEEKHSDNIISSLDKRQSMREEQDVLERLQRKH